MKTNINNLLCPSCFRTITDGVKCNECGYTYYSTTEHPLRLPIFSVLHKRYLIGKLLGYGGFGITYAALDVETNSICAIKEFFPADIVSGRNEIHNLKLITHMNTSFENGKKRFLKEAQTLYRLKDNTAVVDILNYFSENNTAYLVMEMLDGVTLGKLIKYLDIQQLQKLALQVAITIGETMAQAHEEGILHRDISPDNIFITCNGKIKLIDFGASKYYLAEKSTNSRSILLKPGFAPPEQYSTRGNQGPWTDIYALAATYYYATSGVMVHDAMARIEGVEVPSLYAMDININRDISDIIEKAISINIKNRYQNMLEFVSDLKAAAGIQVKETDITNKKQDKGSENRYTGSSAMLEMISGESVGSVWKLDNAVTVYLGRISQHNGIVVKDSSGRISRVHCMLQYSEQEHCVYIMDTSANGTFFRNGRRLQHKQAYRLEDGDEFYLISKKCMFRICIKK